MQAKLVFATLLLVTLSVTTVNGTVNYEYYYSMIDLWWGNCSYPYSWDDYCEEKWEYFGGVYEWEAKDTWEALKNATYWPSPNGRFFDYMGDPWDLWYDSDNSSTPSPWDDHYWETTSDPW